MSLEGNVQLVRQRIERACLRGGRDPASVTLVAVTKGVSAEVVQQALTLGLVDLGENRVQEARQKYAALNTWLGAQGSGLGAVALSPQPSTQSAAGRSPQPVRWHLIGHLQRNKAGLAVELFDVIHSVDSLVLIEALDKAQGSRLQALGQANIKTLQLFIQVNVSGEMTKFGCRPEETVSLAQAISKCRQSKLVGLMTMAPFSDNPEPARTHFRRLRSLRDDLAAALSLQPTALSLSMGMSNDFEVAIEEGADCVRIGTAIFGERSA